MTECTTQEAPAPETPAIPSDTPVATQGLSKQQQERMQSALLSSQFGNMVTVLMQTEAYASMPLSALRNQIVPPLLNRQFRVAEARKDGSGHTIPVALILWAQVSQEVHDRFESALDKPFELKPEEWKSGDTYWIIDAIGAERFLSPLLTELRKTEFKDKKVHYRTRTPDGPKVTTLKTL